MDFYDWMIFWYYIEYIYKFYVRLKYGKGGMWLKIKILGLIVVLMCFFGNVSFYVLVLDFDYKIDFILNDSIKLFVLENISDVLVIDYILGY